MAQVQISSEDTGRLVRLAARIARSDGWGALRELLDALIELLGAERAVACLRGPAGAPVICARPPRAKGLAPLWQRMASLPAARVRARPLCLAGEPCPLAALAAPSDGDKLLVVALERAPSAPPFGRRERALLAAVRPLLARTAAEGQTARTSVLAPRELEVALLAARGLGDREIASALSIGFASVRTYLQRAFAKLGVSTRTELARLTLDATTRRGRRRGGRRRGRRPARRR
jgi:DNA-binding CsgD family transcriptional regulator